MPEDRRHASSARKHTSSVRRIAGIMFNDIVGYTTLMGKDEDGAFDMLRRNQIIHQHRIKKHFRVNESIS